MGDNHCYFNPRSREGSDTTPMLTDPKLEDFNPRSREGSDPPDHPRSGPTHYFNPRSREGSDVWSLVPWGAVPEFQSTLP